MSEFRVIDLRSEVINPEPLVVVAHSPEHAAEVALGLHLVRSGSHRNLCARVYFQHAGTKLSLVRLYKTNADVAKA